MNTRKEHVGSCLCGAVGVVAGTASNRIDACHCNMCRNWGGGPLLAVECASDVVFGGEEHISRFDSSEWAERGFCAKCGTHLFYRLKSDDHYAIPVGLFDSGADWKLEDQIFIDEKPAFCSFAEKTRNRTGDEVFAEYQEK